MSMMDSPSGNTLYHHIGLYSGVYLRTVLDEVSGELSDTRTWFLGPKPVKLFQVKVKEQPSVLALSSRPWLGYSDRQTNAPSIDRYHSWTAGPFCLSALGNGSQAY